MKSSLPLAFLGLSLLAPIASHAEYRVVGYLPDYHAGAMKLMDWSTPTHIMAAFLNPDANGNFTPSAALKNIVNTAKTHSNVKIYLSIAGAAVPGNWGTMMNASNRAKTAGAIAKAAADLGVQGIDVDLEGSLVQSNDFNPFVSVLNDSLKVRGLKMTAAVAMWTADNIADSTFAKFEFINLMTYDYTGSWETSGNHAHSTIQHAVTELDYYANQRNIPKDKIVLGVPFYGYDFVDLSNVAEFSWTDISMNNPEALDKDSLVIPGVCAKYFNGRKTIRTKANMAANYGGIMIWELGQDDYEQGKDYSLLNQIAIVKDSANGKVTAVKPKLVPQLTPNTPWNLINSNGQNIESGLSDSRGMIAPKTKNPGVYMIRSQNNTKPFIIQ